ncbi:MAG: competence/damage-inducible protein A [Rikenellaceae bacterium]|nr:competence/damage-inducible protein A [Rikenellaceae bacterium]
MKATIITIGDEILIGQILDTNSRYISRALNAHGIVVAERTSIGDRRDQIVATLDRALAESDIVIITGGLGPTKDDITKHTLCNYFGSIMRYDEVEAEHIRTLLAARNIAFNELNRGQAMVPECCTVLHNAHGTAPGMWFEHNGRVVVSLPGVPFEMQHLIDEEVMPRLKAHFDLREIVHRTMITFGIAESILAERIAQWEDALPEYLHLAYLPAPNVVRLRLSAYEVEGKEVRHEIDRQFATLRTIIPDNIAGFEDASVEELVHNILIERGDTLAVAESCTGGTIASKFTAQAGASAYFLCGVVSYSNEAKCNVLGVNPRDIEQYGAVSEQVAKAMAEGARVVSGAKFAISTTGIAGPTGGSAEKPVGTVWIGVATPEKNFAVLKNCGTDRSQIISRATAYAIALLYEEIK